MDKKILLKRTKIVCTLGPASDTEEIIEKLFLQGMNVCRFNFSHGSHPEHLAKVQKVRAVEEKLNVKIPLLLDTKGPEIRLGKFKEKVTLKEGQEFTLTTREVEGNETIASVSHTGLPQDVKIGGTILIDDGLIELQITKIEGTEVHTIVKNAGLVSSNKGVNLPNVKVSLPGLTEKDISDLKFGCENDFNFIAASFVRTKQEILTIRQKLKEFGKPEIQIIAKIENQEGLDNFEDILAVSDGIMVARGDLGTEIAPEKLPMVQKMMIRRCKETGKFVITATQMLDSMIHNPRPTRAEVADVANAIVDGTTSIMLSGETANGKYPIEAVKFMTKISLEIESKLDIEKYRKIPCEAPKDNDSLSDPFRECMHYCVTVTANTLNAKFIICVTRNGHSAQNLCMFKPNAPILAICDHEYVARQLSIRWGVFAIYIKGLIEFKDLLQVGIERFLELNILKKGDLCVVAGSPKNINYHFSQNVGGIIKI